MLARRREFLSLGGLLSSGLSILFWLHFASSIFGGSTTFFKFELYFGLIVFVGYMIVDTQDIIEKAHLGDLNYMKHSLNPSHIFCWYLCSNPCYHVKELL